MSPATGTRTRTPWSPASMAYAALRNAVGDRQYVAARLGHLSDETKLILSRFGFEAPVYLKTMRTRHCEPSGPGGGRI